MNKEQYLAGLLYSINYIEIDKINSFDDFRNNFDLVDKSQLDEKILFIKYYIDIKDFDYNSFFETKYSNNEIEYFLKLLHNFLIENSSCLFLK